MKNKRIKIYKINKGQYLNEIEPFKSKGIPSNIILFKELPGCGATRCEIEFPRHSIIVEPNVPVIKGKKKQFGKLVCGIFEGVTTDDILAYLENNIEYKKLIVTPESFWKVKEALEDSRFEIYTDFFLLFDECEKIIQDISYRTDIALPMDDFFRFEHKAFVSATPIVPSDPRFELNKFTVHKIQPSFTYAQSMQLICTNNVLTTTKKFIDENPNDKYFIFFNTTDTIHEVITKLKIKNESMVFCAEKSRRKLRINGYKDSDVKTEITAFKKYNFFTSRFFSAVDIDYDLFQCNPTIILITDIVSAQHSMLDPFTEAIQIQGRFRETKEHPFTRNLVHISNVDPELISMSEAEVKKYLAECHIVFKAVHRYHESATTAAAKDVLSQVLKRIDYAKYLKKYSLERNYDMIDNLIFEERVKGIYQNANKLKDAYSECSHFKIDNNYAEESYSFTDKDRKKANKKNIRLKSLNEIVADSLTDLHTRKRMNLITEFGYTMEITSFQLDFPEQMAIINKYGIDNSELVNFNIYQIQHLLIKQKKQVDHFGMMTYIQQNFQIGKAYTGNKMTALLKVGFKDNNIHGITPSLDYLRKFAKFNPSNKKAWMGKNELGKDIRGYIITKFEDGTLN
ncbi:hypothetical protein [Pedobacter borealis]|uniref:hypothetical protein n=1 Tax=Pedobacter borealis TaxID=475254 RepID=UPI0006924D96|nr:hypothetical protein [Pedobacter borealis]